MNNQFISKQNQDIRLLAYKNSANYKTNDIKSSPNEINNILTNFHHINHEVNYKHIINNLKKETNELNQKLALVIEKDKEISKLSIELEKCKNIIIKYNVDEQREKNKDKLYKELHDKYQESGDTINRLSIELNEQKKYKQELNKLNNRYVNLCDKLEESNIIIKKLSLHLNSQKQKTNQLTELNNLLKEKLIEKMNHNNY
jgi:hypothetical protein